MKVLIHNGLVVTENRVLEKGYIVIEGERITKVGEDSISPDTYKEYDRIIDAKGMYIMPGIIDIHSDAIEKEIEPRPNTFLPLEMAYYELEKKLASSGITTMYHSLSLGDGVGVRDTDKVVHMVEQLNDFINGKRSSINHKIHLRYEILFIEAINKVLDFLSKGKIHYLSFMDHSPGQGQYQEKEQYAEYAREVWEVEEDKIDIFLENLKTRHKKIDWKVLSCIASLAEEKGINVASHDDDTKEKVDKLLDIGVKVTEFPINLETAKYASDKGMLCCVGAPNIIRGGSHNKNLKAIDAISKAGANIVCSDYIPSAMLPAIFKVDEEIKDLSKSTAMFTINPAKAVNIHEDTGSIKEGKKGDIILVELYDGYPIVRKTLCDGNIVYENSYK